MPPVLTSPGRLFHHFSVTSHRICFSSKNFVFGFLVLVFLVLVFLFLFFSAPTPHPPFPSPAHPQANLPLSPTGRGRQPTTNSPTARRRQPSVTFSQAGSKSAIAQLRPALAGAQLGRGTGVQGAVSGGARTDTSAPQHTHKSTRGMVWWMVCFFDDFVAPKPF